MNDSAITVLVNSEIKEILFTNFLYLNTGDWTHPPPLTMMLAQRINHKDEFLALTLNLIIFSFSALISVNSQIR